MWSFFSRLFCCPQPQVQKSHSMHLSAPPFLVLIKNSHVHLASHNSSPDLTLQSPSALALHIASQLSHFQVIIDAFGGIGGNTLAFAQYSDVIVFEIDRKKIFLLKQNTINAGVQHQVDIVYENFFLTRDLQVDVVFLNPDCLGGRSLFGGGVRPNLKMSVKKAKSMGRGIVLLLPGWAEEEELAELFGEDHPSIEIERVFIQGKLRKTVVYWGVAKRVHKEEELEFVLQMIMPMGDEKHRAKVLHYLNAVCDRMNVQRMIQILVDMNYRKYNNSYKFFDKFQKRVDRVLAEETPLVEVRRVEKLSLNMVFQQKEQTNDNPQNKINPESDLTPTRYSLRDLENLQHSVECELFCKKSDFTM